MKPIPNRINAGQKVYTGIIFNPARTNRAILKSIKLFPNIIFFKIVILKTNHYENLS